MEFDKNRVYTALNADELKAGDWVLVDDTVAGLRAQVEGKVNHVALQDVEDDGEKKRFIACNYHHLLAYLVERAPEKKWRAYKDCDEMISDFKKRYEKSLDIEDISVASPMWHPMIWVKKKRCNSCHLVIDVYKNLRSVILNCVECSLEDLFECYTYMDGSPCGVEE